MLTVLVSQLYDPEHTAPLYARFPQVRFVRIVRDEPFPQEAREAKAFLYAWLGKTQLSALLQMAPLEWIHTGSAGFDWVMVPEIAQRNIVVSRSAEVMHIPMAEFAIGAMLSHYKNFEALKGSQQRHAWEVPMHAELYGKTIGIVGTGAIGKRLAHLCKAFGMHVVGVKRSPEPLENFDEVLPQAALEGLLPRCDIVVLLCPLTPETRHMMAYPQFALMKRSAYFINLARGALTIEEDLVRALQDGLIAGACVDAFETEPLPPESPLWDAPNLMLSPHCSYRTPDIRARVIDEFAHNLQRYLEGKPPLNTMKQPALGY